MLRNLPVQHVAEAAIAGAQLLPHLPNAVELLQHADAIQALAAAFLEEHSASDIDTIAGLLSPCLVCRWLHAKYLPLTLEAVNRASEAAPKADPRVQLSSICREVCWQ